jgi:hypothetical protein
MKKRSLIILAMNGALAFKPLGRKRIGEYVSEMLAEIRAIAPLTYDEWEIEMLDLKGSIIRANQREAERFVRKHMNPAASFIGIGHSTGAWNIMHVINRICDNPGWQYGYGRLITIDMNYFGAPKGIQNRNHELFSLHTKAVHAINFWQPGPIGGLLGASDARGGVANLECSEDHLNIYRSEVVLTHVKWALESLLWASARVR